MISLAPSKIHRNCGMASVFAIVAAMSNAQAQDVVPPIPDSGVAKTQKPAVALRKRARIAAAQKSPSSARAAFGDVPGGLNGAPRNPKTDNPSGTIQAQSDNPKIVTPKKTNAQSKSTINSDAIQNSGAQNTYDAIKNVPGVTQADAKGGSVADSLQIRGIKLASTTGYRLDGALPVVNNLIMPLEDKERVETLKGASALTFGLASPAGVINYVMKRATDLPILSFGYAGNQYGQSVGVLDVGRRFGFDKQFGLRLVLAGGGINNGVHNTEGVKGLGALAFDWNPSERFALKVDFEQYGVDTIEQGTLLQDAAVNGRVPLPRFVPNYFPLNSGPWAKYQGIGQNLLISGAYKLDYGLELVGEIGRSETRKLQRNLAQIGTYNIATGVGKETVTQIANQDYVNTYVKGEIRDHVQFVFLTNDLTLGINRNERDFNGSPTGSFTYAQNIYSPMVGPSPTPYGSGVYAPDNDYDIGYYAADDVGIFNRIHLLGGVREVEYHGFAVAKGTGIVNRSSSKFAAPSVGIVVNVLPFLEFYASNVVSLQETGEAPQNAVNAFQVLPPAQASQTEVGLRVSNFYNASATFAAFRLDQANAIINSTTQVYAINGVQDVRGIEGTFRYTLLPDLVDLTLVSGGQLSYSVQHSSDVTINNMESENAPRVSGNLGFVYRPANLLLRGLTLNAGSLFTGSRQLTNYEQGKIPAVTTFSAGANYVTQFKGHRVTYNVACTNLLNKSYYSSALNGALGIGRPRTVTFGGRFDF